MKKKIGEIIIQIIPVMLGVYLGFVVSNWSENNKTKYQTELLRKNLQAEIQSNKNKIKVDFEYHQMIRDSSRYYQNFSDFTTMPHFFEGTRTITLTNSAFETGIQTGLINSLEFEEIQALNNIYTMQSAYKDFNNLLLTGLITTDFKENNEGIRKFYRFLAASMTDIVIKESNLIKNYDELLNKLESE